MRFITGLFIGSTLATLLGVAVSYASYEQQKHKLMQSEHNRIIAVWDKENAERKAANLKLELDAARRSERDPVNKAGVAVTGDELIPAPAVPFPVKPVQPVEPTEPVELKNRRDTSK